MAMFSIAAANARSYDWGTWLIGLMRAFFSGGAVALVALTTSSLQNLTLKQKLWQTGAVFVVMGLYRLGEFLQLHGAPDQVQASLNVAADATDKAAGAIADAQAQASGK